MHSNANNLYGWGMFQKIPVNGFKWIKNYLNLMNTSQKIMMKIVIKDIFLQYVEYSKNWFNWHRHLPFLRKRKKI